LLVVEVSVTVVLSGDRDDNDDDNRAR